MSRIFSWFQKTTNSSSIISRKVLIDSLIVNRQTKEFSSYLQTKDYRTLCIDGFFQLLPSIVEDTYMNNLFELITKKSRLKSAELSAIIVNKLSRAILDQKFDLCERILQLPFPSQLIPLPTYELNQLIHTCSNVDQIMKCLSMLIEKNLPYDAEYFSWILIILFEHYKIGDEVIIEYLLNTKTDLNLLFASYGNNHLTPLMLLFHLYSNDKCQILIDHHLSNIKDESVLLQCDRWNRSYLTHLLCGQCEHEMGGNSLGILPVDISEIQKDLMNQCPHASAILSKFSTLHKLGNQCDAPMKTIFTSRYCLPLRILLCNYLFEHDSLLQFKTEEFFMYFPPQLISIYSNYLKQLVRHRNLNQTLVSVILHSGTNEQHAHHTVKFLLQQGARIDNMDNVRTKIIELLFFRRSMIPFMLLDYSFDLNITFDEWALRIHPRTNLYICRVLQYGYPSEFRSKFDEFKSRLPSPTVELIDTFINVKNPPNLTKLCLQKIRGSVTNLGDETKDKLRDYLPNRYKHSLTLYGYDECLAYYRTVTLSE